MRGRFWPRISPEAFVSAADRLEQSGGKQGGERTSIDSLGTWQRAPLPRVPPESRYAASGMSNCP